MSSIIPVPLLGNPQGVSDWAARYRGFAQNLKRAADDLRDLTDEESYVSLAVDELRLKALDARTETESIAVRYDGAADAFAVYATELEAAQTRANNAINAFHNSDGPGKRAEYHRDELERQTRADGGQTPSLMDEFLDAKRRAESFLAHAASALAEYHAAVQDKRDAIAKAKNALDRAGDKSGLNDNFFEAIAGDFQEGYEWAQEHLAPILKKLNEALKVLSEVLGKIALALTVLSVFIPALAPLAAAVSAVALAVSVALLITSLALFALGRGSLGAVLGDAISVVTSKFGGKLVGGAVGKGGTTLGAGFSSANKLLNPTMMSQAQHLFKYGATNSQLIQAGGEVVADVVGDVASGAVRDSGLVPNGWDMAPSAAGADWNAPPTIEVPSVFADVGQAQTAMTSQVSGAMNPSIPVLASFGG